MAEEGETTKYITGRLKKRERPTEDGCAGGVDQFNTQSHSNIKWSNKVDLFQVYCNVTQ